MFHLYFSYLTVLTHPPYLTALIFILFSPLYCRGFPLRFLTYCTLYVQNLFDPFLRIFACLILFMLFSTVLGVHSDVCILSEFRFYTGI
jgi:hypothetical protein